MHGNSNIKYKDWYSRVFRLIVCYQTTRQNVLRNHGRSI